MQGGPNPALPGLTHGQVVVLTEKLHTVGSAAFLRCHDHCITHFGEDSIPYHPGEKACVDRCVAKTMHGFTIAKQLRNEFEEKVRNNQMPYRWMKDLVGA